MDKTAIKNFSIWARNTLMNDVRTRLGMIGITENGINSPLPASTIEIQYFDVGSTQPSSITGSEITIRDNIVSRLKQEKDYSVSFKNLIENTASSWFNRLVAIRFMEVNDHFDDGLRVLSSSTGLKDPDLLSNPFDSDIDFSEREKKRIRELMNDNQMDELFLYLLFKRCNQLHKVLPGLFERSGDSSEFLMKLSYIDKDGVISHLVHDINEEDWKDQVQIIGWMYQYYNSELKDETFAKKGKISKEEIPAVTQLFTPEWIVRYMVENSLGRLWVEGHPEDNHLIENWKYYIEDAKQEPEVQKQLLKIRHEYSELNPEDLTFIDPCMGSGHILVYAFDVLMQIYEAQGYTQRDAAQSILKNNIYGLDIDDRAYQLAYFAIMMKAKQYDRRILSRGIVPNVFSIHESNTINRNHIQYLGIALSEEKKSKATQQLIDLLNTFIDAKEFGSILNIKSYDWKLLHEFVNSSDITQLSTETVGIDDTQKQLIELIDIAEIMEKKYWVSCTNPPYLAVSSGNHKLNTYVKTNYPAEKIDLYTIFITKCRRMTYPTGFQAMITQHGWMFLGSFETMRKQTLHFDIVSMAHLGARAFEEIGGEVVQTTTFIMRNSSITGYCGSYVRLVDAMSQSEKEEEYLARKKVYSVSRQDFMKIPGCPVAYWVSDNLIAAFSGKLLGDYADTKQGFATGDNERFLRLWFETSRINTNTVPISKEQAESSSYKWFPCTKGGTYRKWYGNNSYLVNWEHGGREMTAFSGSVIRNPQYYFREGITWSSLANQLSLRYTPKGFLFESKGSMCYAKGNVNIKYLIALLNSKIASAALQVLSPTLDFHEGPMAKVPVIVIENTNKVVSIADECINLSKLDWDSSETSWEFKEHPIVKWSKELWDATAIGATIQYYYSTFPKVNSPIELCYLLWQGECDKRFAQLKENEEELNKIFIEIYGLQDELTSEVEDKDVTVRKADLNHDIKSLISYAVGCIFGRYSLDVDGLAYAGGEWDSSKYRSFIPDNDNILPITDEKYLSDDLAERFFSWISVVFGEESLETNLQFIADALGGKGNSRDTIRSYLMNDFFKDHCSTYSVAGSGKRPIYWLFDSGKRNGFKALIYMHRYSSDTIGRVRVNYLHKIQEKYENEVRAIETFINSSSDQKMISRETKRMEKLVKQIEEVKAYDEKLEHLAAESIEINLDDGVKKNYEKIQTDRNGKKYQILAPIK